MSDDPEAPDGESPEGEEPRTADHYRHPDGTTEVVYAVEEGRILVVREYESVEAFERAVADARYLGLHEGVEALPDVSEFEDDAD
ncbi:hypothetical protein [Halomarina ordinaria]|uniref:Uncharacterized protein n=1 Tax=Halomarina ordinaria TaxID=3033939 RepID=A0ABD5UJG5_9EURY|nr:hypothetical protein [Halomarina sp. PSRA2]